MIHTDPIGHAEPGQWYRHYLHAWHIAFPRYPKHPGRFYSGAKWASSTPAWDTWWFETRGCKPPRYRVYVPPQPTSQKRHLTEAP